MKETADMKGILYNWRRYFSNGRYTIQIKEIV